MHTDQVSRLIVVLLIVNHGTCSRFEPTRVKYVVPTYSHYFNETELNKSNTLNNWIKNGPTELFASNTKIVLYSGVHEIQLSMTHILIENINSFIMTGQNTGETQILCNKMFYFHFFLVSNITLTNFTITNCAYNLNDMIYRNISLYTLLHVTAYVGSTEFSFVFSDSDNITIESISVENNGGILIHHSTSTELPKPYETSVVKLLNNKISILSGMGFGFVIPRKILKSIINVVAINNTLYHSCLFIRVYSRSNVLADVSIKNLTMRSPECESFSVLTAEVVRNAYFQDIIISDGHHQRKTYFMANAQLVIISGNFTLQYNKYGDTMIVACNVTIAPKSLLYFTFIDIRWRVLITMLFHIYLTCSTSFLNIDNSSIIFENNHVSRGGIFQIEGGKGILSSSIIVLMNNTCQSQDSDAELGAVLMLKATEIVEVIDTKLLFFNNSASHLSGGITMIKGSKIYCVHCELKFFGNRGGNGGAVSFYGRSQIRFARQTCFCLHFENNWASKKGGAIFVEDSDYLSLQNTKRFYEYGYSGDYRSNIKYANVTTYFKGNRAEIAGNDIYGGWIDQRQFFIDTIWPPQSDDFQSIASDPTRVCINVNLSSQCALNMYETRSIPGDVLNIRLVSVGQRYGIVPAKVIVSSFLDHDIYKQEGVYSLKRRYSDLQLPIRTNKSILIMQISPEGSAERISRIAWSTRTALRFTPYRNVFHQLQIVVHIDNCPLGFKLDNNAGVCICLEGGDDPKYTCNVTSFQVIVPVQKWINATFSHILSSTLYGVIVHNHCPYDYCKSVSGPQSVKLEQPDDQCSFYRSGILCGQCQSGLSNILGSSQCRKCSSVWLLAVIPGVLISGVFIVVMLTILNLNVSSGAINGIIFYANIVRANQALVYTQNGHMSSIVRYFIAWLNLDIGIETCFYDGFNAYAMAWFQFVFPIYVWSIMITIIISSHYSTRASKLSGSNAVSVLATLFLLSYTKILRTVITIFSSTILEFPDGFSKRVWLYDGNIDFLHGKHIPLFIVAILTLTLLSVPYTLSLITIQWLRKVSHFCMFSWVGKLMPLFDSYVGPYRHKHCYWTGLLLLMRVVILLVLSLNQSNNPTHNFTAVACIAFVLLAYLSYIGGVYRNKIVNILETLMLLNLGLLSIGILHELQAGNNTKNITYTSISITFAIFLAIVLYHAWLRFISTRIGQMARFLVYRGLCCFKLNRAIIDRIDTEHNDKSRNVNIVTHTSVELEEPLLHTE